MRPKMPIPCPTRESGSVLANHVDMQTEQSE